MDARPGLRDRKKIQTRRLILKSANKLFRRSGFAATTLEDIAQKAGVHKQTVLRYFGSKEEIALAFRQVALHNFKKGLADPNRRVSVLQYWRNFIETSTTEVAQRGDLRYRKQMDSDPALMAASLKIQIQYEEILASELSREAGENPERDLYARLLAALLVNGNASVARLVLSTDSLDQYAVTALSVVDFVIQKFPPRSTLQNLLNADFEPWVASVPTGTELIPITMPRGVGV